MFDDETTRTTMYAIVLGMVAALGQLLASDEKLTWRAVTGRAISSGVLGLTATLIWIPYPEAPMPVVLGFTGVLVSLGTSGLERLIQVVLRAK